MHLQSVAYHLEKRIALSAIRSQFESYELIKREHSFLLYKITDNSYIYVKDYGSVVFMNCTDNLINQIVSFLINKESSNVNIYGIRKIQHHFF